MQTEPALVHLFDHPAHNSRSNTATGRSTMRSYASSRPSPPPAVAVDYDDSWEVRAFAEDTSSSMGTTWPSRFYHCTFCHREFRSAQALGGHMNVHRRDRARMLLPPNQPPPSLAPTTPPALGAPSTFFPLSGSKNTIKSYYEDSSCLLKLGSSRTSSKEEDDQVPVCEEPDLELRLGW